MSKFGIVFYLFMIVFAMANDNISPQNNPPKNAEITQDIWSASGTLLGFFSKYNIPHKLYYDLSAEDRELTSEIYAGARFYTLNDIATGELIQALIPIGEGMQIHITKNKQTDLSETPPYKIDFTPIIFFEHEHSLALSIQKSPYQDILDITDDKELAGEFVNAYKYSVDFRRQITQNDKLAIIYDKKYRMGKSIGSIKIKAALVQTNSRPNYLFSYSNGKYYDINGREVAGFLLKHPVKGARISSHFSLGRRHPVLKIVRPHYGVDFAVQVGTRIRASSGGKVVFAGTKGGYGKVIEIAHSGGIKTLYAHLSRINVKRGQSVKQGSVIGHSGNTGISTGPHLHFGVYKNNRPVNPLGTIKVATANLSGEQRKQFLEMAKSYQVELENVIASMTNQGAISKIAQNEK